MLILDERALDLKWNLNAAKKYPQITFSDSKRCYKNKKRPQPNLEETISSSSSFAGKFGAQSTLI